MIADEAAARAFCQGFAVEPDAIERLEKFLAVLTEENGRQNLVAPATLAIAWQRHIADSAQLLSHVPRGTSGLLDLGAGAGFPGMVLAILRPDWAVSLVESRRMRYEWLARTAEALGLANVRVHGARLENVETFSADIISARAFAPLPKLLDLSARFSTSDTVWLLPKGRSAAQEWSELPKKRKSMFHVEQSLTDPDAGIIVGKGKA